MYSIILTREANTPDIKARINEFLQSELGLFLGNQVVSLKNHGYDGFILVVKLTDNEIPKIKEFIREFPAQSCIHFNEGVPANPDRQAPRPFDFEDYMDTDISGYGMEMEIDKLINDVSKTVKKCVANQITQNQAVGAIGELWIDRIQEWINLNKG